MYNLVSAARDDRVCQVGATLDEATTQLDLIELSGGNAEFCRTGAYGGVPR